MSMSNAERQAAYRARQKEKLEALRNSAPATDTGSLRNDLPEGAALREVQELLNAIQHNEGVTDEPLADTGLEAIRMMYRVLLEKHDTARKIIEMRDATIVTLRNDAQGATSKPSRNGKCRKCEKAEKHLQGAKMWAGSLQRKLDACEKEKENKDIPPELLQRAVTRETSKLRNEMEKAVKARKRSVERLAAMRASRNELLPDELREEQTKMKAARTRIRNETAGLKKWDEHQKQYEQSTRWLTAPKVKLILNCLHPDRQPEENKDRYTKAFAAFRGATS